MLVYTERKQTPLKAAQEDCDYILKQILSTDMYELLMSLDKMVKSDDPRKVFEQYTPLYKKLSNTKTEPKVNTNHKFF